ERNHCALGRSMRCNARNLGATPGSRGRDVDDHPTLLRQVVPRVFGGIEQQVNFIAERVMPVLNGQLADLPEARGRGIVLEAGDRAMLDLRSEEHTSELQSRENLVCR